jgi:hypothetical protein
MQGCERRGGGFGRPLVEVLPHIQREIDEELRPLVLHAFDGHPSAVTTGEAGADRQAEPRYHGRTASRRRGGRGRDRWLPARPSPAPASAGIRCRAYVLRGTSRGMALLRYRRGGDVGSRVRSAADELSSQPDVATCLSIGGTFRRPSFMSPRRSPGRRHSVVPAPCETRSVSPRTLPCPPHPSAPRESESSSDRTVHYQSRPSGPPCLQRPASRREDIRGSD